MDLALIEQIQKQAQQNDLIQAQREQIEQANQLKQLNFKQKYRELICKNCCDNQILIKDLQTQLKFILREKQQLTYLNKCKDIAIQKRDDLIQQHIEENLQQKEQILNLEKLLTRYKHDVQVNSSNTQKSESLVKTAKKPSNTSLNQSLSTTGTSSQYKSYEPLREVLCPTLKHNSLKKSKSKARKMITNDVQKSYYQFKSTLHEFNQPPSKNPSYSVLPTFKKMKSLFEYNEGESSLLIDSHYNRIQMHPKLLQLDKYLQNFSEYSTIDIFDADQESQYDFTKMYQILLQDFKKTVNIIQRLKRIFKSQIKIGSQEGLFQQIEQTVEEVKENLLCDKAAIYIYDQKSNQLWTKTKEQSDIKRISSDEGTAGYTFKQQKVLSIDNCDQDERFKNYDNIITCLSVPITNYRNQTIGVLQAQNKRSDQLFSVDDEGLLQILANQLAIYLKTSKDHNKTQLKLNSQNVLLNLQSGMFNQNGLTQIMIYSEERLQALMSAVQSRIFLICHKHKCLFRFNQQGVMNYPMNLGIIGQSIKNDSFIQTNDTQKDFYYNYLCDIETNRPSFTNVVRDNKKNQIAVFQVIFTKSVNNNTDSYFDIPILDSFSSILSMCIEKVIQDVDFDSIYENSTLLDQKLQNFADKKKQKSIFS